MARGPAKEREYHEVILTRPLRRAVECLNPTIPAACVEAVKPALGVGVEFSIGDGKGCLTNAPCLTGCATSSSSSRAASRLLKKIAAKKIAAYYW